MKDDKGKKKNSAVKAARQIPFDIGEKPGFGKFLRAGIDMRRRKIKLWENARFITAEVPLRHDGVKRILPFGMGAVKGAPGMLFIVNYTATVFTVPYREAALLVPVRTLLGKGMHCCWMVVDDDTALIYGREVLGYPKKLADIPFNETKTRSRGSVSRRGTEVISMDAKRGAADTPPAPLFNRKTFNCGGPGQMFWLNPVWLFKPAELFHESYGAEVTVRIGRSPYDPLAEIIGDFTGTLPGRIVMMDILGSPYMLPVGMAGMGWFMRTYNMRYR